MIYILIACFTMYLIEMYLIREYEGFIRYKDLLGFLILSFIPVINIFLFLIVINETGHLDKVNEFLSKKAFRKYE